MLDLAPVARCVEDHGRAARAALVRKVADRRVAVESHGFDKHGRLLATLWIDDRDIGREMVAKWLRKADFGYFPIDSADAAKARVRSGELAFAVIIPPDFSAMALPARMADEGRLEIHTSAGNNYQTYLIAKKFAEELDAELNQTLSQQRWRFVLNSKGPREDLIELREVLSKIQKGTQDLSNGLHEAEKAGTKLNQGAHQFSDEINKLGNGTQQMGTALRNIESSLPPVDDVRRLRVGAEELALGHQELDKGAKRRRFFYRCRTR